MQEQEDPGKLSEPGQACAQHKHRREMSFQTIENLVIAVKEAKLCSVRCRGKNAHMPIPTYEVVDDNENKLDKIMAMIQKSMMAKIKSILTRTRLTSFHHLQASIADPRSLQGRKAKIWRGEQMSIGFTEIKNNRKKF